MRGCLATAVVLAAAVAFATAVACANSSLFLIFIVKTEKRQYYSGQIYNFIVVPDGDGFA